MRGTKAKKLRQMAYGDRSLRQKRQYEGVSCERGNGSRYQESIVNAPKSDRAVYQNLKKKFPQGARVVKRGRAYGL